MPPTYPRPDSVPSQSRPAAGNHPCACCPRDIEATRPAYAVLCGACRARADALLAPGGGGGDVVATRGIGSTWIPGAST